ncbi:MAG: hypothetical protein AAB336_03275 [Acidobacteriota bacterium]
MLLAPNEAYLFFKLMLPLQFFVNGKLGVLENIKTFKAYEKVKMQEKFKVRNALFENPQLIDEFIDENPNDIPMKELAHASKWKNFLKGEFYIERYLKNHAILIGEDNETYGVIGLTDSIEEFVPSFMLPQLVQTILLPFQGKIVHDGFLVPYQIYFGGNIKRELKDVYMNAKKRNKIITAF